MATASENAARAALAAPFTNPSILTPLFGFHPPPQPSIEMQGIGNGIAAVNKAANAVAHPGKLAASALAGVVNPILADLKYGAIWVGLLVLGVALIWEGLAKSSSRIPSMSRMPIPVPV